MKGQTIKSITDRSTVGIKDSIVAYKYIPRFIHEIKEASGKYFWINAACRIVQAFMPLAMLWVGKNIVDEVLSLTKAVDKDFTMMWQYIGLELLLFIVNDILSKVLGLTDGFMGDLYSNASSVKLIQKTKAVELSSLEDPEFYNKLNLARTQTAGRVFLLSNIMSQIQDVITVTLLIAGLIYYEPWLIVLLILSVIPSLINELKYTTASYSLSKSFTSERRELDYLRYIGANDKTAKEIKLFNLSDFISERFFNLSDRYYQENKNLSIKQGFRSIAINAFGTLSYYGAYIMIIFNTVAGKITLGELTFLSSSFNRLKGTLQGIFIRFGRISENALYLQDYYEFIDFEVEKNEAFKRLTCPTEIVDGFEFRDVTFSYPDADRQVLKGVSFHIKAGEKIAFVGENGSGKTTMIKLMLRFYNPTSGAILLDGVDIRHYDIDDYQRLFGVIFQDFVQYEFTVGENIAVGQINLLEDKDKIHAAADKSLASDVVFVMPKGLDQQLGKRFKSGKELSGGQWQKIALARAYMKDAKVMVLDEPTSALDARAEYEAFQRFIGLTKGRTSVIISHRFSTVRMADRILVLKDGVIDQLGTHEELIEQEGIYAELFDLQAAGYQ
jgi:ATP-binding cassette, subfamily B, bacterial